MIDQILEYNSHLVAEKGYGQYKTDKHPDKKLSMLSCMDTRLTELLPATLGLRNGDAKIIKSPSAASSSTAKPANWTRSPAK